MGKRGEKLGKVGKSRESWKNWEKVGKSDEKWLKVRNSCE